MSRSRTNFLILLLTLVGWFVTSVLTYKHFKPTVDICGKSGGCEGALESAYGHVGPIPTSLFGLGLYVVLTGLCLRRRTQLTSLRAEEKARAAAYATAALNAEGEGTGTSAVEVAPSGLNATVKQLDLAVWVLALMGCGISVWLQYIALYKLEAFCPWCFTSATLLTVICLIASWDYWLAGRVLTGEQKLLGGVLTGIFVLSSFVYASPVYEQYMIVKYKNGRAELDKKRRATDKLESGKGFDRKLIVPEELHVKGDPKAPYLLVEFVDFMCSHCKLAQKTTEGMLLDRKDFRLAMRHFPLSIKEHQWSSIAAEAAEAAGAQGKFWKMAKYIFEQQDTLSSVQFTEDRFNDFAATMDLDVAQFKKDMANHTYKYLVERDMDAGEKSGVTGTPMFFIVTPTQIWRFGTMVELETALHNPQHPMWK